MVSGHKLWLVLLLVCAVVAIVPLKNIPAHFVAVVVLHRVLGIHRVLIEYVVGPI